MYVEKKGIKEEEVYYTTPKGSLVKVEPYIYPNSTINCEIITPCKGGSPKGAKGTVVVDNMPGLRKLIEDHKKKKESEFEKRYPNMEELGKIIDGHERADYEFEKTMESGSSIFTCDRPEISIKEVLEKYPEEAAYLRILKLADADPSSEIGFIRRQAGKMAIELLEKEEKAVFALEKAQEQIEKETESPEYREKVAGL